MGDKYKVSVIGAGNVGSTLAMRIAEDDIADVVLLDIVEGMPQGKAVDISDAAYIKGHERKIIGTNDYKDLSGSDIIVITAGLARKPGMSRDDLINKNAVIIKGIVEKIKNVSKDTILIVVTNPLDVMAYYAHKISGFSRAKVLGMAGTLDTSRFKNILSEELSVPRRSIDTFVMGSHGDTMVPLISKTTVNGKPLRSLMNTSKIQSAVDRTRKRGAEVVGLLKTGSAYYSPSAGVIELIRAIKRDSKEILPASVMLNGEYGIKGCFLGVPVKIGKEGVLNIEEIRAEPDELDALKVSAEKTKLLLKALPNDV